MSNNMQSITILGATGSIGISTLDVIARHPERYRVFALSGHSQVKLLSEQCLRFQPQVAVLGSAQAAQELAVSQRRLAELAEHLQSSIEQERAAIAREIHDDIGGSLTAIRFDLAWIGRHTTQDSVREHAHAATSMLQHAIGASQRIMMNLRPPILDQGLVAAVQWLAEGFERRTGVPTKFMTSSLVIDLPNEVQLVAYRTAQEALTNISKYAAATQVRIDLSDSEEVLTLEICDNGCGLNPLVLHKPKAFGIRGLQERARMVNGWLDISGQEGVGTSIILSVPLLTQPDTGGSP